MQRFVADFEEEALEVSQRYPQPKGASHDAAHRRLQQVLKDGGNRVLGAPHQTVGSVPP